MTVPGKTIGSEMAAAIAQHKELQKADGGVPNSLVENRLQQDRLAPFWAEGAPHVATIRDFSIPLPTGPIEARFYHPDAARHKPVILFLHGGGWARGTIATGEWACRALAAETGFAVVSLAYSLAPDRPFPAALNDISAAMDWCFANVEEVPFDGRHIFLTGTSAGANLSLAVALARRDEGKPLPIGLGLLYGPFDDNLETGSYKKYGPGQYGLSRARMAQYFDWYVPDGTQSSHPLISPINADLTGLPPVFLGIAEFDVLRDDSFQLAGRLVAANVPTEAKHYVDLAHGYAMYARMVPSARSALSDTAHFFRETARSTKKAFLEVAETWGSMP